MNRGRDTATTVLIAALLLGAGAALAVTLTAVLPTKDDVRLELGDLDDYAAWLEDTGREVDPLPFAADPLDVGATGEVRAQPDVAVITALIAAEDPNESRALDAVSAKVNAVQAALGGYDAPAGFTAIGSRVERDEACLDHNIGARFRHRQIQQDYRFNKRLDDRGDTETRRRPPRPRIAERVCPAQNFRVFTRMSLRVAPADVAGDVLNALAEAGAEDARLSGYDFSDYDALYRQAAGRAVELARAKAQVVARGAGGELGELVAMSVDRPERLRRFGAQPRIIRPARPRSGDGVPALASFDAQSRAAERMRGSGPITCPDGSRVRRMEECRAMQSNSLSMLSGGASMPEPVMEMDSFDAGDFETVTQTVRVQEASTEWVQTPNGMVERRIPAVTKTETRRVPAQIAAQTAAQTGAQTNALTMSLLSGPQVIRVTARLSFDYATPLDGVVIVDEVES